MCSRCELSGGCPFGPDQELFAHLNGPGASERPALWLQRRSAATNREPFRRDCAQWLRERIASGPFTLRGLTAELAERGIKTHPRAVWVFVHAEGLSFKKTLLPEEQIRPDVARKRARWKTYQSRIAPTRLVFIDETWVKTNMAAGRVNGRPWL